jgi:hypothetical protein
MAVALVLFGAVFALRLSAGFGEDVFSVLYVLPISLLAMSFGFRAGLAAGAVSSGLVAVWIVASGEAIGAMGWTSRATPLLLLGSLVGIASDRLRDAERIERHAAAVAVLQREAAEVHDDLVQGLAVTKWVFESGDHERGLEMLEENLESAQQLVTTMLGTGSVLPGDLRRSRPAARPQNA